MIQSRLMNGMHEFSVEEYLNYMINGGLYNNLNQAVMDAVEESKGKYLLTLTEYNRIISLLDSYEYPKSLINALGNMLDQYSRPTSEFMMDYEMFVTWLRIQREEAINKYTILYLDIIKSHAEKFELNFYELIDFLIPDDGVKLSDELKRLREYPDDFKFVEDYECYIIENIGGIHELFVDKWDLNVL